MKKKLGIYSRHLECRHHPELDQWEVTLSFCFVRPNAEIVKIPTGVITDFASTDIETPIGSVSIPGFPPDSTYDQAAIVHDYLYQGEFVPRILADTIFKEALEAIPQVPRWKIPMMYAAVRLFGGFTYKKHSFDTVRYARSLSQVPDTEKRPLWKDGVLRFV